MKTNSNNGSIGRLLQHFEFGIALLPHGNS
jgi:hypothetical protein